MRFGAKTTLLPGLVLIMAGLLLFTQAPVGGDYVSHVLPVMLLFGAGVGTSMPALMTLAMSGATRGTRTSCAATTASCSRGSSTPTTR